MSGYNTQLTDASGSSKQTIYPGRLMLLQATGSRTHADPSTLWRSLSRLNFFAEPGAVEAVYEANAENKTMAWRIIPEIQMYGNSVEFDMLTAILSPFDKKLAKTKRLLKKAMDRALARSNGRTPMDVFLTDSEILAYTISKIGDLMTVSYLPGRRSDGRQDWVALMVCEGGLVYATRQAIGVYHWSSFKTYAINDGDDPNLGPLLLLSLMDGFYHPLETHLKVPIFTPAGAMLLNMISLLDQDGSVKADLSFAVPPSYQMEMRKDPIYSSVGMQGKISPNWFRE
jgi:hypothetical protein